MLRFQMIFTSFARYKFLLESEKRSKTRLDICLVGIVVDNHNVGSSAEELNRLGKSSD